MASSFHFGSKGAAVAPTILAYVWILEIISNEGWVFCWFVPLPWKVFLGTAISWLNAPGLYLKIGGIEFDPPFYRGRRLSMICNFLSFFLVDLLLRILGDPGAVCQDGMIFPFTLACMAGVRKGRGRE